jgi:hypothetical protein
MPTMRRTSPEPAPTGLRVEHRTGMAAEMFRELAPLLAEEGIDFNALGEPDVADLATLQAALNRAVERHNLTLFTPVGRARELAVATLRLAVEAITEDDTALAAAVLDQAQPESPDGQAPTVSACIGLALGLLDTYLASPDSPAPRGIRGRVRLPEGHWFGERAATDILVLAGKGRAFRSLDTLLVRQGGQQVLYGPHSPSPPPSQPGRPRPGPRSAP